jgi:hypothetical protein
MMTFFEAIIHRRSHIQAAGYSTLDAFCCNDAMAISLDFEKFTT